MSTLTIRPAPVRKSITVKADAARAFAVFTGRIGSWWPRSHCIASSPQKDVVLEPKVGGRWFEIGEDGSQCNWGMVLAWEPPLRVLLAWQINANWKYDPELVTEVEVTFTPVEGGATPRRSRASQPGTLRRQDRGGPHRDRFRGRLDRDSQGVRGGRGGRKVARS